MTDALTRADFPAHFRWGTATASYQIEGSATADGRGPSIWDTFSHTPGRVVNGDTGDVACDHYRRMPEDIALLADLGVNAYRFSVSWPRIQPTGSGAIEARGLDFYDRVVDELAARDIAPSLTLYHWDLPQALEDRGGWLDRDTAYRFADYAAIVADRLSDRLDVLTTLNEPFCAGYLGYGTGVHAPGQALGLRGSFPAIHHLLLAHGLAARAVQATHPSLTRAITINLYAVEAATDTPADIRARDAYDAFQNRLYLDPVLVGRYPDFDLGLDYSVVRDGDLELIAAPIDLLGVNYYHPVRMRAPSESAGLPFESVDMSELPHTAMDWPVEPDGLRRVLVGLRDDYGLDLPPIAVTENGSAFTDEVVGGAVVDTQRLAYLRGHISSLGAALDEGVDVRGYYAWSLLDNFEWAEGYDKRFGIVHVDFDTQMRTPKASGLWYREFLTGGGD